MPYRLLASGYRPTISLISFDPQGQGEGQGKIDVLSDTKAPENASWLELALKKNEKGEQVVYTISEDEEKGSAFSCVMKGAKVEFTGEERTNGAPAHGELLLRVGSLLGRRDRGGRQAG